MLLDRRAIHRLVAEHRVLAHVHLRSSSSLEGLILDASSEQYLALHESRSLLPFFSDRLVELHDHAVVARADIRVVQVVPKVDMHEQVEAAIVPPTSVAIARRGVQQLVVVPLKFVICLQLGLHGVPGVLLGG